jgi:hypothetical protein
MKRCAFGSCGSRSTSIDGLCGEHWLTDTHKSLATRTPRERRATVKHYTAQAKRHGNLRDYWTAACDDLGGNHEAGSQDLAQLAIALRQIEPRKIDGVFEPKFRLTNGEKRALIRGLRQAGVDDKQIGRYVGSSPAQIASIEPHSTGLPETETATPVGGPAFAVSGP